MQASVVEPQPCRQAHASQKLHIQIKSLDVATCAFMMRSMLALQPYLLVTTMAGELASRALTFTADTAEPSTSFHHATTSLNSSCRVADMPHFSVWTLQGPDISVTDHAQGNRAAAERYLHQF